MNYEISKEMMDGNGNTVKDWEEAAWIHFDAWCQPEDADKAEAACIKRAKRWCSTHPGSYVFEEERVESYNGEIIVGCSVYKNEY